MYKYSLIAALLVICCLAVQTEAANAKRNSHKDELTPKIAPGLSHDEVEAAAKQDAGSEQLEQENKKLQEIDADDNGSDVSVDDGDDDAEDDDDEDDDDDNGEQDENENSDEDYDIANRTFDSRNTDDDDYDDDENGLDFDNGYSTASPNDARKRRRQRVTRVRLANRRRRGNIQGGHRDNQRRRDNFNRRDSFTSMPGRRGYRRTKRVRRTRSGGRIRRVI